MKDEPKNDFLIMKDAVVFHNGGVMNHEIFSHSVFYFGKLFSLNMALVHNDVASFDKTSV